MNTLYLIGFMGSGKSTAGELLQARTGLTHLDTDEMVEERYGTIATIFEQEGEHGFRFYETEMLLKIPPMDYIISTGGGIVEREENISFMKSNGKVIYLDATFEEISDRLGHDPTRPLWHQNRSDKERLYERRKKLYSEAADITIATDGKTPQAIIAEIATVLGLTE